MLRKALTFLLLVVIYNASAQDTSRKIIRSGFTRVARTGVFSLDTNRVVHDENGKLLHYYQYQKLINTGGYTLRVPHNPGDPPGPPSLNAPAILVKVSPAEAKRVYELLKPNMAIRSELLREGNKLDLTPFMSEFGKEELAGKKAVALIFWESGCAPCVESLASLDEYFKTITHPNDMIVIAISHDSQQRIDVVSLQKQVAMVHFIGGSVGQGIDDAYQLHSYPSYVVADKDLVIRFGVTGLSPFTMPHFKETINELLAK